MYMMTMNLIKIVPVFTLITIQSTIVCATMPIFLTYWYEDFTYFSTDIHMGGFGFLHPDQIINGLVLFGIISGFLTLTGSILCLQFISPLIVTASFLSQIFIGQFLGFLLEIDKMPGYLTLTGTIVVFVGILILLKADQKRKDFEIEKKRKR